MRSLIIALVLLFSQVSAGTKWPVTPANLASMLQSSSVKPGDTLDLADGTYLNPNNGQDREAWRCTLQGTAAAHIVVRGNPGWKAKLDAGNTLQQNGLTVDSRYVEYREFELFSSHSGRSDNDPQTEANNYGSYPSVNWIKRGTLLASTGSGTGNDFINLYVHDGLVGLGSTNVGDSFRAFGCLFANNGIYNSGGGGRSHHGHNIYIHNQTGEVKEFYECITLNGFSNNCQAWSGSDNSVNETSDLYFKGFISILNGPSADGGWLLGNTMLRNARILDCMVYQPSSSPLVSFCYESGTTSGTITGNYLYGKEIHFYGSPSNLTYSNNYVSSENIMGSVYSGSGNTTTTSRPTVNRIFVRPVGYGGATNVVIYNWTGASSVNVDLSSVLKSGENYTIYDVQNPSVAVASGKYAGPVPLSMTLSAIAKPIGDSPDVRVHTSSEFACFRVIGGTSSDVTVPPPPPPVTTKFRTGIYWHHSVGECIWDRSIHSNLTPPTTIPKEIAKYNTAHNLTGSNAVSLTKAYGPQTQSQNNNNWDRWERIFQGNDPDNSLSSILAGPIVNVKTCYIQQQSMSSAGDVAVLQGRIRNIVGVMKQYPDHFFILWNNYPSVSDGSTSSRSAWSAQFSVWMKDVLAKEATFPKNVYVFDVFRKLANATTGVCPAVYGSGSEGPGGDHPSNEAVAVLAPAYVNEVFNAAIAYETGTQDTTPPVVTKPVVSLAISPLSRVGPGQATLSYSVSNDAVSASIDNGVGAVSGSSSKQVQVTASTTYKLTATNSAGPSTATASIVVTAAPPPPPPTDTTFRVGDKVMVDPTDDVNCRTSPSLSGTKIKLMVGGTKGTILGGPVLADDYHWYNVQYSEGTLGWSAGEYLVKDTTGTPPPPPPPPVNADSVKFTLQGIAIGYQRAVAKFDSVRQAGFTAGRLSVVCPDSATGYTKGYLNGFTAGKASVICPPTNTRADSLYRLVEPFFIKP